MATTWAYTAAHADCEGFPQAASRLAEVNRMLAAETERLQAQAQRMQLQAAPQPPQRRPPAAPRKGQDFLALAEAATSRVATERSPLVLSPRPRQEVGEALGELDQARREAQRTIWRLQTDLGATEDALQRMRAERQLLHSTDELRVRAEATQICQAEVHQIRLEHQAREEVLESFCEQLRRASAMEQSSREGIARTFQAELQQLRADRRDCEAALEEARARLTEVSGRELRARTEAQMTHANASSELEELCMGLRRLHAEREADAQAREVLDRERESLGAEVRGMRQSVTELHAARVEDRRALEAAEQRSRSLSEEKLRLHADRGRLRDAHQKAEQEIHVEQEALQEARLGLQRAGFEEVEAERRYFEATLVAARDADEARRGYPGLQREAGEEAAEARRLRARLQHEAHVAGEAKTMAEELGRRRVEDERLVARLRAEVADLLEGKTADRRRQEEADLRSSRDREAERRSQAEVENKLHTVASELQGQLYRTQEELRNDRDALLCLRTETECKQALLEEQNASLRAAVSQLSAEHATLEGAIQEARYREQAALGGLRDAEERERTCRQEVEQKCENAAAAAVHVERLRINLTRLEAVRNEERQSMQTDCSEIQRAADAELRNRDEEIRLLVIENQRLLATHAEEQQARGEAERKLGEEIAERNRLEEECQQLRRALAAEQQARRNAELCLQSLECTAEGEPTARPQPGSWAQAMSSEANGVTVPARVTWAVAPPPLVSTCRHGTSLLPGAASSAEAPMTRGQGPAGAASASLPPGPGPGAWFSAAAEAPPRQRGEPWRRVPAQHRTENELGLGVLELTPTEAYLTPQGGELAPPRRLRVVEARTPEAPQSLGEDLRLRLAAAATHPQDEDAGPSDLGEIELRKRALLFQLHAVVAEIYNLPDNFTGTLQFQRLRKHLEQAIDADIESSEGTRTPSSQIEDGIQF